MGERVQCKMMANLESNYEEILHENAREMRHHGHDWFKKSHEEWCREHNQPAPVWADEEATPKPTYPNCTCGGWMVSITIPVRDVNHAQFYQWFKCVRCDNKLRIDTQYDTP